MTTKKNLPVKLDTLQKKVLELQDGLSTLLYTAAEKAWVLGQALNELKAVTPHGEWEPWCRKNLRFSIRQTQVMMQIGTLKALPDKSASERAFDFQDDPLRLQDLAAIASIAKREECSPDKAATIFLKGQRADAEAVTIHPNAEADAALIKSLSGRAPDPAPGKASTSRKVSMTREQAFAEIGITGSNIEVVEETLVIIFRGLMQKRHPDKGGTDAGFARLNNAKEILNHV